jgi:hypothetical protein
VAWITRHCEVLPNRILSCMRKSIIGTTEPKPPVDTEHEWLPLDQLARAEMTSEDSHHPLEDALSPHSFSDGWRAASPGRQTIRFIFDAAQPIRRIRLRFVEAQRERTQEFVLRWFGEDGKGSELLRQQWNFSPSGSTTEVEDVTVNLPGVVSLELVIDPDQGHAAAVASLAEFRIA